MKNLRIVLLVIVALIAVSSCSTTVVHTKSNKKIPPGQMKKLTGSKSASPYAPGKQKKSAKTK